MAGIGDVRRRVKFAQEVARRSRFCGYRYAARGGRRLLWRRDSERCFFRPMLTTRRAFQGPRFAQDTTCPFGKADIMFKLRGRIGQRGIEPIG